MLFVCYQKQVWSRMPRQSLASASDFDSVLGRGVSKRRGQAGKDVGWHPTQFEEEVSSKIRCKDTKIFWNMQILKHEK